MIEVKCDICKQVCNPFKIFKIEETHYEIKENELIKVDDYDSYTYVGEYHSEPHHKELDVCEDCKNKIDTFIESCIEEIKLNEKTMIRVNNCLYNEKEMRV